MLEQRQQQTKGLLLQPDRKAGPAQFARGGIGFECSEAKIVVRCAWLNIVFLLRWNSFADSTELLVNALDLIPCGLALPRIQVRDGSPRQLSLRAVYNRSDHLQIA